MCARTLTLTALVIVNPRARCSETPAVSCGTMEQDRWVSTGPNDLVVFSGGLNSASSASVCAPWCDAAAVAWPINHVFGNGPDATSVCLLRDNILAGKRLRCGFDGDLSRCALFVGNNLEGKGPSGVVSTYWASTSDCTINIGLIKACSSPPPSAPPPPPTLPQFDSHCVTDDFTGQQSCVSVLCCYCRFSRPLFHCQHAPSIA